ncbi:MAG TPA: single-stranded-DNA-specific exonuclease RecJ [Steroidobacteraceae bacterium]|jgi:single-stranded-DNA-specific exonuclease|nr:single-stranded-DNA-specific exonuclease RecJ [Steroidobacteraceae bacterium]
MKDIASMLRAAAATAEPAVPHAPRVIRARALPADALLPDVELPPVLRRVYAARGVTNAAGLAQGLDRLLPIGSLENVAAAAELLILHRERSVLVIGDFDADGATSTALVVRALRAWGFAQVDFLVPDRFRFGYGLTPEIVELAAERLPSLLVTVDNGVASNAGVSRARQLGMQVLITDHHLPGRDLPEADVIVNPNLPGSQFGSRALAGVGVAFYVMAALRRRLEEIGLCASTAPPVTEYLDLVALGTVADLVPLDVNNRILVAQGLRRIRAGRSVAGIGALLQIASRPAATITATDLGFAVAPRLNAAGRLDDMSIGINCLLSDDSTAAALAAQLDELNKARRRIEADMQLLALAAVRGIDLPRFGPRRHGLCIFDAGWHQGVVGLVASRIKDRVRRPVIAFARAGDGPNEAGWLRGSARSVPGVHIRDVLDAIAVREPALIAKFGGHAMAAGLTLKETDLDRFARAFDTEVGLWLEGVPADDAILTDGQLDEAQIALETAQLLRDAGPWGQAFPEPSFDGRFEIVSTRIVGERHVKLRVQPHGSRACFDAIAFNFLDDTDVTAAPSGSVHLVYRLDINEYRGERRLQLMVEHLQVAGEQGKP